MKSSPAPRTTLFCALLLLMGAQGPAAHAASKLTGEVVDLNGQPLSQAMVTLTRAPGEPGASTVTVFTDEMGRFAFPEPTAARVPTAQALGYRLLDHTERAHGDGLDVTLIMRADSNEAGVAPASAWLRDIADPHDRTALVMQCVGCHQLPAPEVRNYALLIESVPNTDPVQARRESWHAIVQYMNYLSAWEFGRGVSGSPPEASRVYSGGDAGPTSELLARTLKGPLQRIEGYRYGAPVIVNSRTVIREYEVPRPNAIREGLTLGDSSAMYLADVSANRIIRVDTATGALRDLEIPSPRIMGPHTLIGARDGTLWVTGFFPGQLAHFDPRTEQWKTFQLAPVNGSPSGVHDLSFDTNRDVTTDRHGRIWYSDISNNALGWFDPASGRSGAYPIPQVPGRPGNGTVYGIAMSTDHTHVWYAQLSIGCFGSFNTETLKFETVVPLPDTNSGPRRISMSEHDVLYVALYGSGQIAEYDTRARRMIAIHDLPDRASAPYSTTWDPLRKVVWIATSNANVIYRLDPRTGAIGVLPLPREGAFLRMIAVDKQSGALVTSYANIVEAVHGPRMGVMIDPGDGVRGRVAGLQKTEAVR